MSTSDKACSKWNHPFPMDKFERLRGTITRVSHGWGMTGTDTSTHWLAIILNRGERTSAIKIDQHEIGAFLDLFEFRVDHCSMMCYTRKGVEMQRLAQDIKEFKQKHNSELATYRRLKKKFEGIDT